MTQTTRPPAAQAMLDAAEAIAVDHGLRAVTLTAVQQHAGQANKSAAAYHFGSLSGLLAAVVERRMHPVDEQRRALLDQLDPGSTDVAALTQALVRPLVSVTLAAPGSRYARFLAQAFIDPALSPVVLDSPASTSFHDVRSRLQRALAPSLGAELAEARIASVVGMLITTCALHEGHPGWAADPRFTHDLTATCVAALSAPAPAAATPTRPTTEETP